MPRTARLSSRAVLTLAAALVGLTAFAATAATFDLSPEQHDRPRGVAVPAAEHAVPASFRFAEPDTLTIGISPALPPISSYATDARTVIGFDADVASSCPIRSAAS